MRKKKKKKEKRKKKKYNKDNQSKAIPIFEQCTVWQEMGIRKYSQALRVSVNSESSMHFTYPFS